jgi:hypothetical protein
VGERARSARSPTTARPRQALVERGGGGVRTSSCQSAERGTSGTRLAVPVESMAWCGGPGTALCAPRSSASTRSSTRSSIGSGSYTSGGAAATSQSTCHHGGTYHGEQLTEARARPASCAQTLAQCRHASVAPGQLRLIAEAVAKRRAPGFVWCVEPVDAGRCCGPVRRWPARTGASFQAVAGAIVCREGSATAPPGTPGASQPGSPGRGCVRG